METGLLLELVPDLLSRLAPADAPRRGCRRAGTAEPAGGRGAGGLGRLGRLAVALITDLVHPFSGLIRVPSAPLRKAAEHLTK